MPYIFPERVTRTNDSVDEDRLSKEFGDIAEYTATELSEHNFQEGEVTLVDSAMCKVEHITVQANHDFGNPAAGPGPRHNIPPGDTSGSPPTLITPWPGTAFLLPNSHVWEVVDTIPYSGGVSNSADGPELLHVMGVVNYGWTGFSNVAPVAGRHKHSHVTLEELGTLPQPYETPHVMFALRINGTIYNKTGHRNPTYRPYQPIKADKEFQEVKQRAWYNGTSFQSPAPVNSSRHFINQNPSGWPGMISVKGPVTSHPGYAMFNVGFDVLVPVPSGPVTIEVVATRLSPLKRNKFAINDFIAVTSRTVAVVRYFVDPPRGRRTSDIPIVPVNAGDTLSSAALNTFNLAPITNKLNTLGENDLNVVNRYHMPSMLHKNGSNEVMGNSGGAVYVPPVSSNFTTTMWYPGPGDTVAQPFGSAAVNGWDPLGVIAELSVGPQLGNIPTSSLAGKVVVTARVMVQDLKKDIVAFNEGLEFENHQGALALFYEDNTGARRVLLDSVAFISRRSTPGNTTDFNSNGATGTIEGRQDVSLMAVIDTTNSLLPHDIQDFGICASVINWANQNPVEMTISRASISFEFYRE